jgi:hypothetical protein
MAKKDSHLYSFVSSLRRHTHKSLGADLGTKTFVRSLASSENINKISGANEFFDKVQTLTKGIGIIQGIHSGLVENGINSGSNSEHSMIPFTSESNSSPLGRNEAVYYKTHVQVGRRFGSKITKIRDAAFVDRITRLTSSSDRDYLDHKERKQLNFTSGFNEKGFSFLMNDTFFSVKDYYDLLDINKTYKQELEQVHDGRKDIFACVLKTKHRFKIKNLMDYHTTHVKIHLIKILDLETDVKDLVKEITHNSKSINQGGKLPIDQQYTDPKLLPEKQFSINFTTALSCNLTLSSRFQERAKIVKSWSRTLSPGSIWEFNLEHYLGKGISINRLYDIQSRADQNTIVHHRAESFIDLLQEIDDTKNSTQIATIKEAISEFTKSPTKKKLSEHPTGYIFCLEYVGDRRASVKSKDNDIYSGYSPCNFNIEFDTEIQFLADQDNSEKIMVYKNIVQEKQFEDDSLLADIFYPTRQPKFHIPYEDLFGKTKKGFKLILDSSLKSTADFSPLLRLLTDQLKKYGLDVEKLSPEELKLNLMTDPTDLEDYEYEGTGGEPPTESPIDL